MFQYSSRLYDASTKGTGKGKFIFLLMFVWIICVVEATNFMSGKTDEASCCMVRWCYLIKNVCGLVMLNIWKLNSVDMKIEILMSKWQKLNFVYQITLNEILDNSFVTQKLFDMSSQTETWYG